MMNINQNSKYDEDNINVLKGLEAVRIRPAMYIGNVDVEGLHHLVYEIVDNSIDEAMAGFCDTINVIIHTDKSVSVGDNGRGIPVGMHKTENMPAVEVVLTKLHAGGKFDHDSYKVSGGLHGVGVSVVNALSELLEVEIHLNGKIYYQTYVRGHKTSELTIKGETDRRGTKIRFKPDIQVLTTDEFSYDILSRRLRELAFLNKGLTITIEDERSDKKESFKYDGGLSEYVQYLNRRQTPLHEPILIEGEKNNTQVEVAIQYNDSFNEKLLSFANNINTIEGGFHLVGFKTGLTRCINQYAATADLTKNLKSKISGDDVREGLTAIVSVRIMSPQFEGQTKTKLGNSDVKGVVESLLNEKLAVFFEENPIIGKKIIAKAAEAARARDAAKRARDLVRSKGLLSDSTLPGKLADCQASNPADREVFIVEGDSAGGSAKLGRDRKTQAILPLRGKILNVEKARFDKLLRSEEIKNLIIVLGTGIGPEEFDIDKIKYHKVIIMTDADVDGSHIRTLLLTFFYRQIPEIIEKGYLYIAQPPLFRVGKGKNEIYLKDEKEYTDYILKRACDQKVVETKNPDTRLSGHELFIFISNLAELYFALQRLEKQGIYQDLAELLMKTGVEDKTFLQDREKMKELQTLLKRNGYDAGDVEWHEERNVNEMSVVYAEVDILNELFAGAASKNQNPIKIGRGLVYSADYQNALMLFKKISERNHPPFYVSAVEKKTEPVIIEDKQKLIQHLIEEGKKGVSIQRYKGLGEMNPIQLWETTMDPETRNLLQVKVENVVETDDIFTVLMGDEVEPRRNFIQNNALEVSVLDI
jgi:DNA gyrase subunit B